MDYSFPPPGVPPQQKEPVVLKRDTGGRGGKVVTLVQGLNMHPDGKRDLLRLFQKKLGTGGTLKSGALELQGDHRERLAAELQALGYRVKTLN